MRDPGVLADLETDDQPADVEGEVTDEDLALLAGDLADDLGRLALGPRLEPARLVVDPIAREEPLGD